MYFKLHVLATASLLAAMTTASAFRSRRLAPAVIALLSFASMIVHTSTIEKGARRKKLLRDMQNASVPQQGDSSFHGEEVQNKQET